MSTHLTPQACKVLRTTLNVGTSLWRRRKHEVSFARPWTAQARLTKDVGFRVRACCRPCRPCRREEREVLVLRLLLDLDTKATARELAIAPGTVRAHLAHAVATAPHGDPTH